MFRRLVAVAATIILLLGSLTPSSATASPAGTASPAEDQFTWLIAASHRLPLTADELAEHFDDSLLAIVGGVDGFNQTLRPYVPFVPGQVISSTPDRRRQVVSGPAGELLGDLVVDQTGRISNLGFAPYLPAPTTWSALDDTLRTLAPRVSFAAARISPAGCTLVHGVAPDTARPLGSAFKLYVLGALAQAVTAGRLSWTTPLALNPAWKSLPSGVLQDRPDGTTYSLAQYANLMISISDNTAADHLIHTVGRDAVRRQFARFGNRAPNSPVLTTREFFALKSWHYPAAATGYLALPVALRAGALPLLDRVPRESLTGWSRPELIDAVEWFGSPMDLCRAYAGLWASHQAPVNRAPVNTALTLNDGGLGLPRADFPTVWFKGGSETGVLTLNYLARAADGTLVTASLLLSDPAHPIDEATVIPRALALLRGAVQLGARTW